jgi:hypothetical protein
MASTCKFIRALVDSGAAVLLYVRLGVGWKRPDIAGRQVHQHQSLPTAIELQENTTMAAEESALAPENPKMIDLRHQLREASTLDAQRDVMVKTILAGRNNEISVAESKVLNMEFIRINSEARARLKEERTRLKAARRTAD